MELLDKFDKALEISDGDAYNEVIGTGKWGIVANGACFNYVKDAVLDLGIGDKVSILKLVMSWPLPEKLCVDFMKKMEKVLVVEELEPINETELKAFAQENGITIPIKGKGVGAFSRLYEYDPGMVRQTIADYFGIEYKAPEKMDLSATPELPARPPNLCAGCPPSGHILCGQAGFRDGCDLPHGYRLLYPGASAAHFHGGFRHLYGIFRQLGLRFCTGHRPEGSLLYR